MSIFAPLKGNDIEKGKQPPLKKRASGVNFASQHTEKKRQDSYDVRLAEKPKRKEKKTPSSSGKGSCSTKSSLEEYQSCQEAESREQSPAAGNKDGRQPAVDSQPENSGCWEPISLVSEPNRYLTVEGESVNTAQDQSDLNRLSAEVAGEHPSTLVDISEDSEVVCARCLKKEKNRITSLCRL